ncbi:MAG: FadR/GntR family transcriptional regulator [Sphingomicrobium sp.]
MMHAIAQPPVKSLVQTAIDAINGYIRVEDLRVGQSLPGEAFFAERLGVSRAVMREAFGALAALKLIDVANGRKPRVGALDGSIISASLDHAISTAQINVADVWDVRRTIEQRTAALAAENATPEQAARIVALAEELAAHHGEDEATTDVDIAFHLAIADASGNELFKQIVFSFTPLMRLAVPQAWRTRQSPEQQFDILDRHRQLARAISDGNSDAASQCMDRHFDEAVGALLRSGK